MMSVKNRTIRIERYLVMQAIATETAAITKSNLRVMLSLYVIVDTGYTQSAMLRKYCKVRSRMRSGGRVAAYVG